MKYTTKRIGQKESGVSGVFFTGAFTPLLKFREFFGLPRAHYRQHSSMFLRDAFLRTRNGMQHPKLSAGFTILELLVVIAIIALLASVILVQFTSARARARDAQRESEIKTLQTALAIYTINTRIFPSYTGVVIDGNDLLSLDLRNGNAINGSIKDPLHSGNYRYMYNPTDGGAFTYNGQSYRLRYYLETDTITGKDAGLQNATP